MKNNMLLIFLMIIIMTYGCSEIELVDDPETQFTPPPPGDDSGVVYGRFVTSNDDDINGSVYLSRNIAYQNPDLPPIISFSYTNSSRAVIDIESGYFYFDNIEPGDNYVIAILTGPTEPFIVRENNSERPLTIIVKAKDSVNLGDVSINIP